LAEKSHVNVKNQSECLILKECKSRALFFYRNFKV